MNVQIEESWKAHLEPEFEKDYFRTLTDFVKSNIASIRSSLRETDLQCFQPLSFRQSESCNYRTRSLPWTGTSAWSLFLCKRRSAFSPFISEYIQRNQGRHRHRCPCYGKSDSLGRTGSIVAQRYADRTCSPSWFTPEPWLGKHLLMLQSVPWQKKKKTWYLSCGDHTLKRKERLSTATNTWYSLPPIPLLFLLTTASSETNISAVQTII